MIAGKAPAPRGPELEKRKKKWMLVVFLHSLNFIYRGSHYLCKLHYIQLVNVHFTYFNPLSHKIVLMYVNGWKLLTFESVFIFLTM